MNRDELLDLIPAYSLDALDPNERAEVEAWLHTDPEAMALLAEYQQVADHLVTLAPLPPAPDHLQADLRQRLAASRTRAVRRARWGRWALVAAAAVVVIGIVGLVAWGLRGDSSDSDDSAALFEQLAGQDGSTRFAIVPGEVEASVGGELVVAAAGTEAVMRVEHLPALNSDQTFQLWLVDQDGNRTSGGLYDTVLPDTPTFIPIPLDRPISAYQGMGVSLEPAGGSPYTDRPTGPRVLSIPLSN